MAVVAVQGHSFAEDCSDYSLVPHGKSRPTKDAKDANDARRCRTVPTVLIAPFLRSLPTPWSGYGGLCLAAVGEIRALLLRVVERKNLPLTAAQPDYT